MRSALAGLLVAALLVVPVGCGDEGDGGGGTGDPTDPLPVYTPPTDTVEGPSPPSDVGADLVAALNRESEADPNGAITALVMPSRLREIDPSWQLDANTVFAAADQMCATGSPAMESFIDTYTPGADLRATGPFLDLARVARKRCGADDGALWTAAFAKLSANNVSRIVRTLDAVPDNQRVCDVLKTANKFGLSKLVSRLANLLGGNHFENIGSVVGFAVKAAVQTCPAWVDPAARVLGEYME